MAEYIIVRPSAPTIVIPSIPENVGGSNPTNLSVIVNPSKFNSVSVRQDITTENTDTFINKNVYVQPKLQTNIVRINTDSGITFLRPGNIPLSENSPGLAGEIRFGSNAVFLATAINFWQKIPLVNFYEDSNIIDGGDI
jgi:hypothetical protein